MTSNLIDFLDRAANHLKYPKVRLSAAGDPLVFSRAGDKARFPGSVNITDGGPYGNNVWYGRVQRDGTMELSRAATPAVERVVAALVAHPEKVVAAYGRRFGNCSCCGRELTDERSVSKGYGPVCADHWGLPWGDKAEPEFHIVHGQEPDTYTEAAA